MSAAPLEAPPAPVSLTRALGSGTRADIYGHLRAADAALTVRDVATAFDLHPNVARTHLETLADAGLAVIGRRKHPGGGRPAKVYLAREQDGHEAADRPRQGEEPGVRAGTALLVELLVGLLADAGGGAALTGRAHAMAAAASRRLVAALDPPRHQQGLEACAEVALQALRPYAPEVRVVKAGSDWVDVAGLNPVVAALADHGELADALERGLLSGAFAAAGARVALSEVPVSAGGGRIWRLRGATASSRQGVTPADTVDARGQQRESGVVRAMRVVTGLRAGDVLEVLTEGPGAPACFARWVDRAGHELLGVERAVDASGRPAIRLLIRKGGARAGEGGLARLPADVGT